MSDRHDQPHLGPIDSPLPPEPTAASTLDELAAYALLKQSQIIARDKQNGEDLWLMGRALELAYQQSPYGTWERWWKAKGFKKTYAWLARKLCKVATLDQVKDLGLTEALVRFGVVSAKAPTADGSGPDHRPQEQEEPPVDRGGQPVTDEGVQQSDEEVDEGDPAADEEDEPEPEAPEEPAEGLDDDDDTAFREYQASLRQQTPLSRAVAIRNALELLLEDVIGEKMEEELQDTFDQIAELAEALRGLDSRDDEQAAALRLRGGNEALAG